MAFGLVLCGACQPIGQPMAMDQTRRIFNYFTYLTATEVYTVGVIIIIHGSLFVVFWSICELAMDK